MRKITKLVALLSITVSQFGFSQQMYILNRGGNNILSVPVDDPNAALTEKINQNVLATYDFVLDATSKNLFWTNYIDHQILSGATDEGSLGTPVASDLSAPVDLEIDPINAKMYWADNARKKVFRSNLDGSEREELGKDSVSNLSAIALIPDKKRLFYADMDSSIIWECTMDGIDCKVFVKGDLGTPVRLLVDSLQQKLYWADDALHRIERINLDGSQREVFYQGAENEYPYGLFLDQFSGMLYWTDYGTDQVMRAKINGFGAEVYIKTGLIDPMAVLFVKDSGGKMGARSSLDTDMSEQPGVSVYPNPANNVLVLTSVVRSQDIEQVYILDEIGHQVYKGLTNQYTTQVDISHLSEGHYIYYVTIKGQLLSGHFTIIH